MSDVMVSVTLTWFVIGWLSKAVGSANHSPSTNISGDGQSTTNTSHVNDVITRPLASPFTQEMVTSSETTAAATSTFLDRTTDEVVTSARLLSPGARPLSDEEDLLDNLFHLSRYNPSARPVLNSSQTVSVQIQFSLMHIKDLDVRSQVLTTTGLLILVWVDERLKWQPEEHNNMKDIILEAKELWTPEFAVINGAEKIYEDYHQFRAVISHEGEVHWEPGGVFKTMCTIDITYYPFDEQVCSLTFGAWSYHTFKMNLTNKENTVNLDSYKENGEWDIFATEVQRNEFSYECCPNERYSNVNFKIYLRRRHTFYILNVILPSVMTSVLLLSIFFCTPGQKVQIGVVVLLSFRIFLLNVAGEIPKTSDHIPLLGIYLTCTMAITTLSMVLTVFVLNLHHITDRPVPQWAKKLILCYLARALGMCSMSRKVEQQQEVAMKLAADRRRQARSTNGNFFRRSYTGFENDIDETSAIIELQNQSNRDEKRPAQPDENAATGDGLESPWVLRNSLNTRPPQRYARPARQNADVRTHDPGPVLDGERSERPTTPENSGSEKDDDFSKEWTRMAEIFDRLFFWLFLFAILITTLVLFHPLTKSYMAQDSSGD